MASLDVSGEQGGVGMVARRLGEKRCPHLGRRARRWIGVQVLLRWVLGCFVLVPPKR